MNDLHKIHRLEIYTNIINLKFVCLFELANLRNCLKLKNIFVLGSSFIEEGFRLYNTTETNRSEASVVKLKKTGKIINFSGVPLFV